MNQMKILHMVAFALVIVGGLNWLLVGAVNWDVGDLFGDEGNMISRVIYVLVGLAAVYLAATHKKDCKTCSAAGGSGGSVGGGTSMPSQGQGGPTV